MKQFTGQMISQGKEETSLRGEPLSFAQDRPVERSPASIEEHEPCQLRPRPFDKLRVKRQDKDYDITHQ